MFCVDLSHVMTLEPGDLIFTGTPPGVGFGRTPPLWMKYAFPLCVHLPLPTSSRHGDKVTCELEGIGSLTNHVVIRPYDHPV